jgi:hypothetical protein
MTRLKEIKSEIKKPLINFEPNQAKIIGCEIKKQRLVSQLDDGREVSLAVSLLTK